MVFIQLPGSDVLYTCIIMEWRSGGCPEYPFLQEDVMEFVNSIAKIVHMEVSLHGGSPNKNIGDAFLLVWKLPKSFTSRDIPRMEDFARKPSMMTSNSGSESLQEFGTKSTATAVAVHAFGEQKLRSGFLDNQPIIGQEGEHKPVLARFMDRRLRSISSKSACSFFTLHFH